MSESKFKLMIPWLGIITIFAGLATPWFEFITVEVSGYQIIIELGEWLQSEGENDSILSTFIKPINISLFSVSMLFYIIGPMVFAISGIIAAITMLTGRKPFIIGLIHCSFAAALIILGYTASMSMGGIDSTIMIGKLFGIGVFICSFSGLLLLVK